MIDSRFRSQLRRQLAFIENSCAAYDRGQHGEAIRIATSLRILLHDTRASTSLLTHLEAKHVPLLSTCPVRDAIPHGQVFDGLAGFAASGPRAKLGDSSTKVELEAGPWWLQPVVGLGRGLNLSRAAIALTAANKDGGAHVDDELPNEYVRLIEGLWRREGVRSGMIPDHHLLYLRQMGYKILNSPRLIDLSAEQAVRAGSTTADAGSR